MNSRERRARNPYLFLLMRSIFKWEVELFYANVSRLSMSRYILEKKEIDIKFSPRPQKELSETDEVKIMADAAYLVSEFAERVGDLKASDQKINDFIACIRLLCRHSSWRLFKRNPLNNTEYIDWGNKLRDKGYVKLSRLEKARLNSKVNESLADYISYASLRGVFDAVDYLDQEYGGKLIGTKHIIRKATNADKTIIEGYCLKRGVFQQKDYLMQAIGHAGSATWLVINDVGEIVGTISFLPVSRDGFNYMIDETISEADVYNDLVTTSSINVPNAITFLSNVMYDNMFIKAAIKDNLEAICPDFNKTDQAFFCFKTYHTTFLFEHGFGNSGVADDNNLMVKNYVK